MDLIEIEKLVKEEISKYPLISNWEFSWHNKKTILGTCSYYRKTIFLSKAIFTNPQNQAVLKNTILHEIAHALTPGDKHGKIWKKTFIKLGGSGETCSDVQCEARDKYTFKCPNCGQVIYKYRKLKYEHACSICCDKFNGGKFSKEFTLELIKIGD